MQRTLSILVVDDNKSFSEVICALLEAMGHKTFVGSDSTGALVLAKRYHPDVIFCDIGLPNVNGCEIAKMIKADDELKSVYLVALTGYTSIPDIERARESGFDQHLMKPVDISQLEKILLDID